MGVTAATAVGCSLALDALFEEYPARVHPVAIFGGVVDRFDRAWDRPVLVGTVVAIGLPLAAAGFVGAATLLATEFDPLAGAAVAGLALFATTSLRMLLRSVATVVEGVDRDPAAARESAVALVGRNTADLSDGELRSAALESAAENLADGTVAPLLAFAAGVQLATAGGLEHALAVGVAAAAWIKAVNTLDSMLGYPEKPIGRASARLDDAAMWVPARVTALLLAAVARSPRSLLRARQWAGAPTSPNSGWPMATLAAALDVRLAKPDCYDLNASAAFPDAAAARAGRRLVGVTGVLAFVLAGVVVWV